MFRIGKTFTFEAGHWLPELPEGHKCARPHGHSYTVEVVLTAKHLTPPGFVVDFGDLAPLKEHVADTFDHQSLNDVIDVAPTSENLASVIFDWCATKLSLPATVVVDAVLIRETSTTWAEYRPANL